MSELELQQVIAAIEELGIVISVKKDPIRSIGPQIRVLVDYLDEVKPDGTNLTLDEAASLVYNYIPESILNEHPCKLVEVKDSNGVGLVVLKFKY